MKRTLLRGLLIGAMLIMAACSSGAAATDDLKVGVVLDTGGVDDRGFNEYTVKGAQEAANELGFDISYLESETDGEYIPNIQQFIDEDYDLIITVGFLIGEATAAAAMENPDTHFAIVDYVYGADACPVPLAEGADCYEEALPNVTSLMFAEDQVGFLAGVLAGCMTETNTIASVAGVQIPPVEKFVTGYQTGAEWVNADVVTLNEYTPSFVDPATGKQVGDRFIEEGADVIFGVGGSTGNGGLQAAYEADVMAIGVDVDQYFTYPEVGNVLMTSAAKNMDVAVANAVRDFAAGNLESGVRLGTVETGGVGLAPYHEWDDRIPQTCKDAVDEARSGLIEGSISTGY